MSRLPIVDAKTMERVLLHLGFAKTRQRGSHAFYAIPMVVPPRFPTIRAAISPALSSVQSFERSKFRQRSSSTFSNDREFIAHQIAVDFSPNFTAPSCGGW